MSFAASENGASPENDTADGYGMAEIQSMLVEAKLTAEQAARIMAEMGIEDVDTLRELQEQDLINTLDVKPLRARAVITKCRDRLDPTARRTPIVSIEEPVDDGRMSSADEKTALNPVQPLNEESEVKLDPRRFWAMAVFCYVQLMNGVLYGTFSSVSLQYTQEYFGPGISKGDVNLLLNWGSILYLPLVPLSVIALNRGPTGIVLVVKISATLQVIGTAVRCIPTIMGDPSIDTNIVWLNVGQILIALSSGVNAVPSSISATWFPKEKRMMWTSIGCASNFVGGSLKFLIGLTVSGYDSYNTMMLFELGLAAFGAVCALAYFPAQPANAVSKTGAQRAERAVSGSEFCAQFLSDLKVAFLQPSLWVIQGGVVFVGVLGAWQASIPVVMTSYSTTQVQWLGFCISVAYSIGCLCLGDPVERFFHQRYKLVLFYGQVLTCLFMALGMLGMDSFGEVFIESYFWVVICLSCMTFVNGALYPCMMELAAEVAYPAEEGAAAGLVTLICQLSTSSSLFMFDTFSQSSTTYLVLGTCAMGVLAFGVVKEDYKRSRADEDQSIEEGQKEQPHMSLGTPLETPRPPPGEVPEISLMKMPISYQNAGFGYPYVDDWSPGPSPALPPVPNPTPKMRPRRSSSLRGALGPAVMVKISEKLAPVVSARKQHTPLR